MSACKLCLRALIIFVCVGLLFTVATAGTDAAHEKGLHIFFLRHCDADAVFDVLKGPAAAEKELDIQVDETQNQILVFAAPDAVKRVSDLLTSLEQAAADDAKSTEVPLPRIPDLDLEKMTDAQMRQAVAILTKQVRELALRIQRLEDAQKLRVIPLSQE